ncbi:MAG: hypothetical protein ABFD89_05830 [Bryobacteraceae bacterium]
MPAYGVCEHCGAGKLDDRQHLCRPMLAALNAEIERLKVQRDAALEKVNLLEWANGKLGRQVVEFSEEVNCRGERITVTIAALRETREALRDVSGLAAKAANCELAAAASLEPDTDVFGSSGIADKALTARSKAAWKELDDRIDAVLARHAPLAEEAVK